MRALLLRLEPLIWGLFGGGMFVGALLLPAWCLVAGVLIPLGLAPDLHFFGDAGSRATPAPAPFSWEHLYPHLSHPLGRALCWAAVALPLWAGAHQLRHLVTDFGGLRWDGMVGGLCYAAAALGSLLAAAAVLAL